MDSQKKEFLEKHRQKVQEGIWGVELELRHFERQKLATKKNDELISLQRLCNAAKGKIKDLKGMLELIGEELNR